MDKKNITNFEKNIKDIEEVIEKSSKKIKDDQQETKEFIIKNKK